VVATAGHARLHRATQAVGVAGARLGSGHPRRRRRRVRQRRRRRLLDDVGEDPGAVVRDARVDAGRRGGAAVAPRHDADLHVRAVVGGALDEERPARVTLARVLALPEGAELAARQGVAEVAAALGLREDVQLRLVQLVRVGLEYRVVLVRRLIVEAAPPGDRGCRAGGGDAARRCVHFDDDAAARDGSRQTDESDVVVEIRVVVAWMYDRALDADLLCARVLGRGLRQVVAVHADRADGAVVVVQAVRRRQHPRGRDQRAAADVRAAAPDRDEERVLVRRRLLPAHDARLREWAAGVSGRDGG